MSADVRATSLTTVTSTLLLDGLRNPSAQTVWQDFVNRYRPMLVLYGQRLGLIPDDAEDAAQQTLMGFCRSYREGNYQRDRGRLRDWLFGIAKHHILNALHKRRLNRELQVAQQTGQTDFFAGVPADAQLPQIWEQEWQQAILRQCLEEIRRQFDAKTLQAFELFARDGLSAKQVAEQLGITDNAVFLAKRRILAKVREMLPHMEQIW